MRLVLIGLGVLLSLSVRAEGFTADDARDNLKFAKDQMLKMIEHVDSRANIVTGPECANPSTVCFPHIVEEQKLKLRAAQSWVSGFAPGTLWKLLKAAPYLTHSLTEKEQQTLYSTAMKWTYALSSEAENTTHHDLGFVLFDSFGEALAYTDLPEKDRAAFKALLQRGRVSLASRFRDQYSTIRSWDFVPRYRVKYLQNGDVKEQAFDIAEPWQHPVIVDNMMNLELLLTSADKAHHAIAYRHADATLKKHYYYLADDTKRSRPIAYHVWDYHQDKPGNWQGLGHRSAWSRGQAWSFYGFTTMTEFDKRYRPFVAKLNNSLEHFLKDDPIPDWDYFASQENAYIYASDHSESTTRYHRLLHLCDYEIQDHILPYKGFAPIQFDAGLLAPDTLAFIKTVTTIAGEPFLEDGLVVSCGNKSFNEAGRRIPKDTSAAAIMAAAYYRWAQATDSKEVRQQAITNGDRIMAALTQRFRTDVPGETSYDLGFLLDEAVGNMPFPREVDTSLIYGDFYFVEANVRKLALAEAHN